MRRIIPSRAFRSNSILVCPAPAGRSGDLNDPCISLFHRFRGGLLRPRSILFIVKCDFDSERMGSVVCETLTAGSAVGMIVFNSGPRSGREGTGPVFFVSSGQVFAVFKARCASTSGGSGGKAVGRFSCVIGGLLPGLSAFRGRRGVLGEFMRGLGTRAGSRGEWGRVYEVQWV